MSESTAEQGERTGRARSRPVTAEEVKRAAIRILCRAENPSVQRVRTEIGHGSNSTIHQHLEAWRAELRENERTVLPASLPETLLEPVEGLWQQAVEAAGATYEAHRRENEVAKEAAEKRAQEAEAQQRTAEERLHAEQARLTERAQHIEHLEAELASEKDQRAAVEDRLEAERRDAATAAERHQEALAAAQAETERVRTHLQERIDELHAEDARNQERFDRMSDYWAREVDKARQEAREEVERYRAAWEEAVEARKSAEERERQANARATRERHRFDSEVERLQGEIHRLREGWEAAVARLSEVSEASLRERYALARQVREIAAGLGEDSAQALIEMAERLEAQTTTVISPSGDESA